MTSRTRLLPLVVVLSGLASLAALLTGPVPAAGAAWWEPTPAPAHDGAWPLLPRPRIVAGFDPPAVRWGAGHRGVDLAGSPGSAVRAALPGRVSFSGTVAGRGVVVVDHGGVRTTYQPVAARVPVGRQVSRGEVVGRLALAGSHCLPAACLHWGLRRGEVYLDPLTLVGGGPVRLLPMAV
ncbi:peptidoglycan DD-metalloendopeptidase family protein [Nocardioides aurantiacus]|uniref:Peptidase M23-like protein n=1 Tax=Nocardioides aurantiacus TaxID=86796 RepID=A0A3N2CXH7_9ACTN|nr:peptidoglycan DD-metalloendopeptidase family protein [Nocardioides aurantiacus]ROR92138.1 peptidase M23-like protein [Nocardioides aurantiacus]